MGDALFDLPPGAILPSPEPVELPTRGERLRQLHLARIAHGLHPLSLVGFAPLRLHLDAPPGDDKQASGPRCGSCWHRILVDHHDKTFPKCFAQNGLRATRSEASDVRAWWPACVNYSPGDTRLSDDAARYVPDWVEGKR